MKKFLLSLTILFAGITTVAFAQQEEAANIESWDGSDLKLEMFAGDNLTYEYTATENGVFYIYSDDQAAEDYLPIGLWGGWYHDNSYDADAPLQDVGAYNDAGVFGWLRVIAGDVVRFTLTTSEDAAGQATEFTLKSAFFDDNVGGDSWEKPITLVKGQKIKIPMYKNTAEIFGEFSLNNATYCKFTASSDGIVSILTDEYVIYVLEESNIGNVETPFRAVTQASQTSDHKFLVSKDVTYIVVVPNARLADLTLKETGEKQGQSAQFPIEITELPATLDLVKGDNFYAFSHELIGDTHILEIATAAGWSGAITYMEDPTENSTELAADVVNGTAKIFAKNVDPRYLSGTKVIANFNMTDKSSLNAAVTLALRNPKEGESFDSPINAKLGENSINGPAGDYWFAYAAEMDGVYSFATSGELKHVNFSAGLEQLLLENTYRVSKGQTIYACVTTPADGAYTFTISGEEVVAGDYCDMPIVFSLGEDVVIKDRGDDVMNYRQFTAEESGFAIFETASKNVIDYHWSIYFRTECGGRTIDYTWEDITDRSGNVTARLYKMPVSEGISYLFEIMSFANEGADVIFTSRLETANEGDICATAIEIAELGDTIDIDNTPESTVWHKYVADRTGFYTTYAKLGRGSNLKVKVGDCDANEVNGSDDGRYSNAYMAGYKYSKVYVEQGQTLYICTIINSDPGNTDGNNYYIVPTFAEARPGERFADPIQAEVGVEYTLTTGFDGYDTWYVYTIPAGKKDTITISSTIRNYSSLTFYKDEKTSLSAYKNDFVQTSIYNEENVMIGKSYLFEAADTERTIYIKAPIATITEPVIWKIEGIKDDDATGIDEANVAPKAPVIYDLMGRRVENPGKGIYIVNGVKRIFK